MNLDYLKEFVVLAETCQFSEAAEQLNMTQSSLSKHIKSLEEELQAPLFVRSTRKAELSTHGRNLVPYARQIVMIYDEYTNIYRPGVYNKTRKFFIGMVPALDMKYFCDFLEGLLLRHPNYSVDFIVHEANDLHSLMVEGKLDMVFVRSDDAMQNENFVSVPYLDDYLVAIVPQKHVLASRPELTAADLQTLPLIKLGRDNLAELFDKSLHDSRVTVGRTGEMMHLVSAGMGIGILPYRTALSLAQGDVVIIPLAPRKDIELKIVYRRNANKDAAIIQEFLDYIESHPRQST